MILSEALTILFSNTFVAYYRAHSYHWNVKGVNFSQYHSFFNDIYSNLYDSLDDIAEKIRIIEATPPINLRKMYDSSDIEEDEVLPLSTLGMIQNLKNDNTTIIENLNVVFKIAASANNQGIANYIADRLDKHGKIQWMLTSYLQ